MKLYVQIEKTISSVQCFEDRVRKGESTENRSEIFRAFTPVIFFLRAIGFSAITGGVANLNFIWGSVTLTETFSAVSLGNSICLVAF